MDRDESMTNAQRLAEANNQRSISEANNWRSRFEAEQALRDSEEHFRLLAENSRDMITLYGADHRYLYVSPACRDLFGYEPEELVGKSPFEFIHPDDAEKFRRHLSEAKEGENKIFEEYRRRKKNGEYVWVEVNGSIIRDKKTGQITQILGLVRDISARKRAEEALQRSEQRYKSLAEENARLLEQSQTDAQTKADLLREVNHRVKNNLVAIQGLVAAEKRSVRAHGRIDDSPILDDLRMRIGGLVTLHEMLSASEWNALPLSELAQNIIHSVLSGIPGGKKITARVTPSALLVTPTQAHQFALILNELATNAAKYALAGREAAVVTVAISTQDGQGVLEFRDDGPGFPPEVLEGKPGATGMGFDLLSNVIRGNLSGSFSAGAGPGACVRIGFKLELFS